MPAVQGGSLSVKLGLVTLDFASDTRKAREAVKDLYGAVENLKSKFNGLVGPIKQFGGAIAGLGLAAAIQQTIAFADEVSDLADGFDLSAAKVLQFRAAIRDAGGDAGQAQKALTKLYEALDKARQGDEVSISKFEKLGITWQELTRLTPEQAIGRVTLALAGVSDSFERVRLAREILGKGGAGLDFDKLAKGTNESTEALAEYAERLRRIAAIQDNIKQGFENFQLALSKFIFGIQGGIPSVEKFEALIASLLTYFVAAKVLSFAAAIAQVAIAMRGAAAAGAALNLVLGATTPLGIIIKGLAVLAGIAAFASVSAGRGAPQELTYDALGNVVSTTPGVAAGAGKTKDQVKQEQILSDTEKQALEFKRKELIAAQAATKAIAEQIRLEKEKLQINIEAGLLSEQAKRFNELDIESAKKLVELEKQRGEIIRQYEEKPAVRAEKLAALDRQVAAERELLELRKQSYLAEERRIALTQTREIEAQGDFERRRPLFETEQQRKRAEIDFKTQREIEQKVGIEPEGGYSSGQMAIIEALRERAKAEKNLLDIQDARIRQQQILLDHEQAAITAFQNNLQLVGSKSKAAFAAYKAVAIAQAIIDTYKGAQAAFAATIGIPFVGPFLAYAAAAAAIAAGFARVSAIRAQQPSGRAAGGPITAGTPYMVGEQGRELIVPSQNGTVIPNAATEKLMANQQANVTIINNPGATLDERVLSIILANMKTIQTGVADENVRRFAPNYYQMGGA